MFSFIKHNKNIDKQQDDSTDLPESESASSSQEIEFNSSP